MGGGSYLASEAEEQLYASEIASEGREISRVPRARDRRARAHPGARGSRPRAGRERRTRPASNPNVFLRTKVQKELGLSPDSGGAAFGDAIAVGVTYLVSAIVPLWPYFFFALNLALAVSLVCTLLALFLVGVAKGRVTRLSLLRAGVQVAIIGSASAGVGFAIGHVVTTIAG